MKQVTESCTKYCRSCHDLFLQTTAAAAATVPLLASGDTGGEQQQQGKEKKTKSKSKWKGKEKGWDYKHGLHPDFKLLLPPPATLPLPSSSFSSSSSSSHSAEGDGGARDQTDTQKETETETEAETETEPHVPVCTSSGTGAGAEREVKKLSLCLAATCSRHHGCMPHISIDFFLSPHHSSPLPSLYSPSITASSPQPLSLTAPGSVLALLDRLRALPFYTDQIVHVERVAGRAARHDSLAAPLHPALARAFQQTMSVSGTGAGAGAGVDHGGSEEEEEGEQQQQQESSCAPPPPPPPLRLYTHQVQAIDALREGRHVIISTPTASGETHISPCVCVCVVVCVCIADWLMCECVYV